MGVNDAMEIVDNLDKIVQAAREFDWGRHTIIEEILRLANEYEQMAIRISDEMFEEYNE